VNVEGGGNGSGHPDETAHRIDPPRGRVELPPNVMTPEQGCLSCGLGLLLLLLSVLFWLYIYWRNEPSFHPPPAPTPLPVRKPAPAARPEGERR
jgi:hypothetical protein